MNIFNFFRKNETTEPFPFQKLPKDIKKMIGKYAGPQTCLSLEQTCKANAVIFHDINEPIRLLKQAFKYINPEEIWNKESTMGKLAKVLAVYHPDIAEKLLNKNCKSPQTLIKAEIDFLEVVRKVHPYKFQKKVLGTYKKIKNLHIDDKNNLLGDISRLLASFDVQKAMSTLNSINDTDVRIKYISKTLALLDKNQPTVALEIMNGLYETLLKESNFLKKCKYLNLLLPEMILLNPSLGLKLGEEIIKVVDLLLFSNSINLIDKIFYNCNVAKSFAKCAPQRSLQLFEESANLIDSLTVFEDKQKALEYIGKDWAFSNSEKGFSFIDQIVDPITKINYFINFDKVVEKDRWKVLLEKAIKLADTIISPIQKAEAQMKIVQAHIRLDSLSRTICIDSIDFDNIEGKDRYKLFSQLLYTVAIVDPVIAEKISKNFGYLNDNGFLHIRAGAIAKVWYLNGNGNGFLHIGAGAIAKAWYLISKLDSRFENLPL